MKFKIECFYSFICIPAAVFFLIGCVGEKYTETTYGDSFLIDSVTVGFIKTVNVQRESTNAWGWGGSYIDGKQEILIYSVPQQKVIKKISFTSGRSASSMEGTVPVVYNKPWIMYYKYHESHSLGLLNLETGEKIALADCSYNPMGGFSPDGKYAFFFKQTKSVDGYKILKTTYLYNISEKRVTDSVQISNVFYLAEDAQFFLFKIVENPPYSNKAKWIAKSGFNNDSPENWDTLVTLTDNLYVWGITDFGNGVTTRSFDVNRPVINSMDSLLVGSLHPIFIPDTYMVSDVKICLKTGIYTCNTGVELYIKSYYKNYHDTSFVRTRTLE